MSNLDFSNNLFVHVPFDWFEHYRETFKAWKVYPEFLISTKLLDNFEEGELISLARDFRYKRMRCTIHAPFTDMDLGSQDVRVISLARTRLLRILEISDVLRPEVIVIHSGYDPGIKKTAFKQWWSTASESIEIIAKTAHRFELNLAVENVNDTSPAFLRKVIEQYARFKVGVCLDIGHINMFSEVEVHQWIKELGGSLLEIHLHDNTGKKDAHLPLGQGTVDFESFFSALEQHEPAPCYTIENTSTDDVETSLSFLRSTVRKR